MEYLLLALIIVAFIISFLLFKKMKNISALLQEKDKENEKDIHSLVEQFNNAQIDEAEYRKSQQENITQLADLIRINNEQLNDKEKALLEKISKLREEIIILINEVGERNNQLNKELEYTAEQLRNQDKENAADLLKLKNSLETVNSDINKKIAQLEEKIKTAAGQLQSNDEKIVESIERNDNNIHTLIDSIQNEISDLKNELSKRISECDDKTKKVSEELENANHYIILAEEAINKLGKTQEQSSEIEFFGKKRR